MFRPASSFDKLLEKATSHLLLEPDWPSIIQICDLVRQGDTQPKYVLSAIKKKIVNPNPHIALFGLQVLESCVKNCGSLIHDEIGTKQYMEQLWDVVKNTQHEEVKLKILELIQAWAYAFRKTPKYRAVQDVVNIMRAEGHKFPLLKESDAMFSADTAPEWADGTMCHRCRVPFTLVQRKHHCRACGQVFCQQCSSKNSTLPKFGFEKEVRVCESCYEQFHKPAALSTKEAELPAEYLNSSLAQQVQVPPRKSEDELREEEEFQLALALSQSEAEHKEKEKKHSTGSSRTNSVTVTKVTYSPPPPSPGTSSVGVADDDELYPELAKYLNRQYWEQKQIATDDHSSRINITSPSAPNINTHTSQKIISVKQQNGEVDTEMEMFVNALQSQVEIFVNRMKSNSSRGRSIANDSSVQTWFMNITAMHSRLLRYIQEQDDKRVYYEGLQDKVAQIKESRLALDALREEHREKLRREAEEAERQRQLQMAHKLEIMRKKKQEYLQYQRQLALQRIQEQEREMQMRQEQQKQQYILGVYQPHPNFIGPPSQNSPVHQVQYLNPGCNYNSTPATHQNVYGYGQPPAGTYPIKNYGLPIGSNNSQEQQQQQQQMPTDFPMQGRENLGHVTISGPSMISQISGNSIPPLQAPNSSGVVLNANLQNNLGHMRPQPQQGMPMHGSLPQRFPPHVMQAQGLQPQDTQTGPQVVDPSNPMGHHSTIQQQGPSVSHGSAMEQHALNINIETRNLGPNQVPELRPMNHSAQLPHQAMERPGTSGPSVPFPATTSNQPINFNPLTKSQPTEHMQQKEEQKLDIAELISFD